MDCLTTHAAAALALENRRESLAALHGFEVSSTLHVTFLSTNCIENAIANWREAKGNVKRWNLKGDMISRWTASGMLWAESGFNKLCHAGDLPELAAALAICAPSPIAKAAEESHCTLSSK